MTDEFAARLREAARRKSMPEVGRSRPQPSTEDQIAFLLRVKQEQFAELGGLLIAIRSHFGRDKFAEMIGPKLNARLIKAIGDGIQ